MKYAITTLLAIICLASSLRAQEHERYNKLVDTTLFSENLGFEKNISVYVPFEWQADLDQTFPLMVIFDMQNSRSFEFMINTIDYLTSVEQIPACVIIGVKSQPNKRYLETLHKESREKGMAKENTDFLFEELIPLAEEQFKASAFRLLVGHSRYGYFTTSLLCSETQRLNAVVSISPFFHQQKVDLTDSVARLLTLNLNHNLYYRFAIGNDYPDDYEEMHQVLKANTNPNFNAQGYFYEAADHNVTPGLSMGRALYEVFEFWSKQQQMYFNVNAGQSSLDSLNQQILNHYGTPLKFSLGTLNGKGWAYFNEEKYELAIEAWELMAEDYPNFSEVYLYILETQELLGKDPEQTIRKFEKSLENTQIYTPEEMKELRDELDKLIHQP